LLVPHIEKEVGMRKRMLGVVFGAAMFVGVLGATPAMARSDPTIMVICSGGQVIVADAHALTGMVTSAGVYNLVNPFGEICTVYP
jgi:hypothetical protein